MNVTPSTPRHLLNRNRGEEGWMDGLMDWGHTTCRMGDAYLAVADEFETDTV